MDIFHAFLTRVEDAGALSGPLADLRLAVKDNIAVEGEPFTAGLPLFAERRADKDASCVVRLKEAGARLVGMTRTDAAGFGVVTPEVINPVWPDRIAGGSSGGSAAAVAAGLADIGLGTDTGGSTRIPAACCGIFGFKPSHGRIPIDGVWPLAPSFDVVGWMARDLATIERVAAVLLGTARAPALRAGGLRLGIDLESLAGCAGPVERVIRALQAPLARAGAEFHAITLPPRDVVTRAHAITVLHEARAVYTEWSGRAALLPETARRALAAAQSITAKDITAATTQTAAISQAFDAACAGVDAILTPTLPVEPPPVGVQRLELHGRSEPVVSVLVSQTCLANLTGAPAISLPLADVAVSLQLIAPKGRDEDLLAVARLLQAAILAAAPVTS
jgi:Asp-tRNA(Asn)/Glu-tRNA(Gln) amidotransferase A subunit family amidase